MSLLHIGGSSGTSGVVPAEGVDFDGVTDYLSRSSDLVGNVDSKTFTFSCWVYTKNNEASDYLFSNWDGGNGDFYVFITNTGAFSAIGRNTSNTIIFSVTSSILIPLNTWTNILISIDLSSTSLRHLYINDVLDTPTWNTYSNQLIDFTDSSFVVSATGAFASIFEGRLSNLFLDYTYRDLSIEANRRLFITADGKPADGLDYVDKYLLYSFEDTDTTIDIKLSYDGTKMYKLMSNSKIKQYSLNTPYDVRTAIYEKSITLTEGTLRKRMTFSHTGEYLYIFSEDYDSLNSRVIKYSLSNWDIETAVYSGFKALGNSSCKGLEISSNGMYLYQCLETTGRIIQYTLASPHNIVDNFSGTFIIDSGTITAFKGIRVSDDGLYLYSVVSSTSTVVDIYVSYFLTPFDIRTLSVGSYISSRLFNIESAAICLNIDSSRSRVLVGTNYKIYSIYNIETIYRNNFSFSIHGLPANTPTAPILYLPMKDSVTAHINEGTGGNFVQNGTLDTASRGANHDNCVASYFDGSADYLSRTSLTGITDSKLFTFSCVFSNLDEKSSLIFSQSSSDAVRTYIYYNPGTDAIEVTMRNSGGTTILSASSPSILKDIQTHTFSMSVDMANTSNRKMVIDGLIVSATWSTYTNDTIYFSSNQNAIGARSTVTPVLFHKGNIGELYFDTKYIDLATSNPFWDKTTNKPVPVRKVIANTGITPLIAMPLDASNAGKNYGTGGDFTANSAPYVGARGASEFWARSAKFDGSTGYLEKTGLISTFPNVSIILCACKYDTSLGYFEVRDLSGVTYGGLKITCNATNIGYTITRTNGGSNGYTYNTTTTTWKIVALTVDWTATTNNVKLYVNGENVATQSYDTLGVPTGSSLVRAQIGNDGSMFAFCYFSQTSIDFSQEVNRNKFVDQLGYPKDLSKQIEAGVIPKPLIYLPFDDPSNLGKNLGTGGNFTVNGTVTAGADFSL